MQISMLRPVGSRVPLPAKEENLESYPWDGRYHTELVDSGTSALSLAIELSQAACQVKGEPEVILPAYGCPDLVAAVLFQKAKPVLVDLEEENPYLALEAVEKALTQNTVAVVAVDFLGLHENLERIKALLSGSGTWLIEDSAQAFPPASASSGVADCVILSFGRGKPINLMGGGALLIRRDHVRLAKPVLQRLPACTQSTGPAWRLRRFVFNLLLSRLFYGLLARLPFLGLGKTEFIPLDSIASLTMRPGLLEAGVENHRKRAYVLRAYLENLTFLKERGWLGPRDLAPLYGKEADSGRFPRLLRFPLLAPSPGIRDEALSKLRQAGFGANALYGEPLPEIQGMRSFFDQRVSDFPNASLFSKRLVLLPLHEDVQLRDVEGVAKVLDEVSKLKR